MLVFVGGFSCRVIRACVCYRAVFVLLCSLFCLCSRSCSYRLFVCYCLFIFVFLCLISFCFVRLTFFVFVPAYHACLVLWAVVVSYQYLIDLLFAHSLVLIRLCSFAICCACECGFHVIRSCCACECGNFFVPLTRAVLRCVLSCCSCLLASLMFCLLLLEKSAVVVFLSRVARIAYSSRFSFCFFSCRIYRAVLVVLCGGAVSYCACLCAYRGRFIVSVLLFLCVMSCRLACRALCFVVCLSCGFCSF